MIERHDRFLLRQRPPGGHLAGLWEFPGGKVETDETWEQALVREVQEELDVPARTAGLIDEKRFEYPERTVRLRFYRTLLEPGSEPRAVEPDAPIRWVTAEELVALPVPDANRELIERLVAPVLGSATEDPDEARRWALRLWAFAGLPVALVLAGMTVMAAGNAARLLGTSLDRLGSVIPGRVLRPEHAVFAVTFVLVELVFVAIGQRRAARA